MPHDTVVIGTIAAGIGVAFVFGLLAARLRLPPIVGYLVAGVVVGPFAPRDVAQTLTNQVAELGVILLMFGVGLHFSLRDLASVGRIVVPAALGQTAITGTVGVMLGRAWGWGWGGATVLGLSLGVASTVVLLKGLEGRDQLDSPDGRLAVGWLVVEDVTMVVALVVLPALAPVLGARRSPEGGFGALPLDVTIAILKVIIFVGIMIFVGRRFLPWLLEHVARVGSRELFTLAVLAAALGVGTASAELFGVSFALGAFFAGAVISESELSQRAAADALPMQDAFAVLFFVSVGMLFDPAVLVRHTGQVLVLIALIVVWKSALAFGLLRLLGQPYRTSLVVGPALGQIGEFSFIVAALGVSLGILRPEAQAVIVAAALVAITLNVPVLTLAARLARRHADRARLDAPDVSGRFTREPRMADLSADGAPSVVGGENDRFDFSDLSGHVVLVGHGRVGTTVAEALARVGAAYVIVEEQERIVGGLRQRGERAIQGDATRPDVLGRAGVGRARLLVVTAPEPFRARRIVEVARAANPHIDIAVRTHTAAEQAFFEQLLAAPGARGRSVYAEREAALSLSHYALLTLGTPDAEADSVIASLRGLPTLPTETFKALPTQEYRSLTRMERPATGAAPSDPPNP